MDPFSPAQCVGYVAFVLGVAAFLQRSDRRLKMFNAGQSFAYAAHFFLLDNLPACSSAAISGVRSATALYTRSAAVAFALVAVNVAVGFIFAEGFMGWLPVFSSSVATVAVFTLYGIRLRLVLLACTAMWLAININSGSIGGTALESFIAVANLTTIFRLWRLRQRAV